MLCQSYHDIIAIFCIGNLYLSDDGLAIHLYNELIKLKLSENIKIYQFGLLGFSQIDLILPYRKLIVIDALKGFGRPGDIFTIDLFLSKYLDNNTLSSHDIGLFELLETIRILDPSKMPKEAILIGVEIENVNEFGVTLSPKVNNVISQVQKIIINEIKCGGMNL